MRHQKVQRLLMHPSRSVQGGTPASDKVGQEEGDQIKRQLLKEKASNGTASPRVQQSKDVALAFCNSSWLAVHLRGLPPGTTQGQKPQQGSPKRKLPARAETPL